jgi:uncharacterized repeat protein (TIGR01451 family)
MAHSTFGARALLCAYSLAHAIAVAVPAANAQQAPPAARPAPAQVGLSAGEAYVTRFSGVRAGATPSIDLDGIVGSIVDLRRPGHAAIGQHWINEPQRAQIRAREAGQVFGVALDDASPPNVYLTATAAFGLHRTADNRAWMPGMWGPGGGPGSVYKLTPESGYKPRLLADIRLDGRPNGGAALGNIAFDSFNRQLLVSDLETGIIHRISPEDGRELGRFDHGVTGRVRFYDAATGESGGLEAVPFDPASRPRLDNCPTPFARSPECWNVADFRRRIWGLGVRREATTGEVRVYYAVWGSAALGSAAHASADVDDRRNWVWSVALTEVGDFDLARVTREFPLPDLLTEPAERARHGTSQPVSDVTFSRCGDGQTMLVAERGSLRNEGLATPGAFAFAGRSRVLRYQAGDDDTWSPVGRYEVGFTLGQGMRPRVRSNAAGGVDFGHGYTSRGVLDPATVDGFVWMTGDNLCTPTGPCFNPAQSKLADGSHVHGLQGTPAEVIADTVVDPAGVAQVSAVAAGAAAGPRQSYMVDTDANLDGTGQPIMSELTRDDSTRIGDIAMLQVCPRSPPTQEASAGEPAEAPPAPPLPPLPPVSPPPTTTTTEQPPTAPPVSPPTIEPPIDLPDLAKAKTGPAQCIAGDICSFTVTITNNGPGTWSGPLFETDTMPPGATLVNFAPQPEWTCNQAGDTLDCEHQDVTLPPGSQVTLTLDLLLPPDMVGPVENCIQDVLAPMGPADDPAVILGVEQRLNALGYAVGAVDGVVDADTVAALTAFQTDYGLDVDGQINDAVRDTLFPGDAGLSEDADPANDFACHTVEVLPPPVAGVAPAPALPAQPDQPAAPPIAILTAPPAPPPPAPIVEDPIVEPPFEEEPPVVVLPPPDDGTPGVVTVVPPIHDPGTHIVVVRPDCPPGTIRIGRRCHPVGHCPPGYTLHKGRCVKRVKNPCPPGFVLRHGHCFQPGKTKCLPGQVFRNGRCITVGTQCPPGQVLRHGRCVKAPRVHDCPPGQVRRHGRCVQVSKPGTQCPSGTRRVGNRCVPVVSGGKQPPSGHCPSGTRRVGNRCVPVVSGGKQPPSGHCPSGTRRVGNRCVPVASGGKKPPVTHCPFGTRRVGNRCVPVASGGKKPPVTHCPAGTRRMGNRCVPVASGGKKPPVTHCPAGTRRMGNRCVPVASGGKHTPAIRCPAGTRRVGNTCVAAGKKPTVVSCPPGTRRLGNRCVRTTGVTPPRKTHRQPSRPQRVIRQPQRTQRVIRQPSRPQRVIRRPSRPQRVIRQPQRRQVSCPPGTVRRGSSCVPIQRRVTPSRPVRRRR